MGGIDKSDMLTHLYKTPLRARRWYVKIFGYIIDLCCSNAWLIYKRDCFKFKEKPIRLKTFRLNVSHVWREKKQQTPRSNRLASPRIYPKDQVQVPSGSHQSSMHLPIFSKKLQTCKVCSNKKNVHKTKWMCSVCNISMCLTAENNCFARFHENS